MGNIRYARATTHVDTPTPTTTILPGSDPHEWDAPTHAIIMRDGVLVCVRVGKEA